MSVIQGNTWYYILHHLIKILSSKFESNDINIYTKISCTSLTQAPMILHLHRDAFTESSKQNIFVFEFLHLTISNLHWSFLVGHVIIDFNILKIDLVLRIVRIFSQHTNVKYVVHSENLRWQRKSIPNFSYTFQNFERSDKSRQQLSSLLAKMNNASNW